MFSPFTTPFAVPVTIKAVLSRTNEATSLQLSGDTGSSFSISSLSSVTFQKFSLSASLTIPTSGSTVINNLAFSGGLGVGALGSGNGTFSYANQATNFTLEVNPTLPAPFKQVLFKFVPARLHFPICFYLSLLFFLDTQIIQNLSQSPQRPPGWDQIVFDRECSRCQH